MTIKYKMSFYSNEAGVLDTEYLHYCSPSEEHLPVEIVRLFQFTLSDRDDERMDGTGS